jgi:hypothetical protein
VIGLSLVVGWLLAVPMRRGEAVYVPTPAAARLVADLTGGLSAPKAPRRTTAG